MSTRSKSPGFTLIELIVAITVSGVVVGFMTMFIATPIQAYFAQARRAELVESADLVLRHISNDVRNALPNSPRVAASGAVAALELLAVVDMASYKVKNSVGNATQELDPSIADSDFSTLGNFNKLVHPFTSSAHYLVVNHTGAPNQDAWQLANVITPTGATINITSIANSEDHVTLNPAFHFTNNDSPTHHVFLVSGPVKYICDTNAGTLTRYSGYAITSSNSTAAPGGAGVISALIANDVVACQFARAPGSALHPDLVIVRLQLSRNGENLPLFQQVSVENLP